MLILLDFYKSEKFSFANYLEPMFLFKRVMSLLGVSYYSRDSHSKRDKDHSHSSSKSFETSIESQRRENEISSSFVTGSEVFKPSHFINIEPKVKHLHHISFEEGILC